MNTNIKTTNTTTTNISIPEGRKKYVLDTNYVRVVVDPDGVEHTLYRIRATTIFRNPHHTREFIKEGDLGGWVEGYENLDPNPDAPCWIGGNGCAYDKSRVEEKAYLGDCATACGNALLTGYAIVLGHASLSDHVIVGEFATMEEDASASGRAIVRGKAKMKGGSIAKDDAVIEGQAHLRGTDEVGGYEVIS